MEVFYLYGDDSADEKRERVCAIGVVAGPEEMWNAIEPKWIERNNGIPFHAKDCESDQGDYANLTHRENKVLYRDLTTMLVDSGLGGLGISIDLAAQRKIFPNALDLAYYKAFMEILERTRVFVVRQQAVAKFTFDISTENEYNAGLLYATVRENEPDCFERFDPEISFVSAKDSARVQAGDLMAYEAMKALDHTVGPKKRRRASWDALRATERFEVFSYSEDWLTGLKKDMANLEKKLGYDQESYLNWLKEKNRQHSVSNLFHFTNHKWKQTNKK